MKTVKIQRESYIKPVLSFITVSRTFPNENLNAFLDSLQEITVKHEIIVVATGVQEGGGIEKYLSRLLDRCIGLVKVTIVATKEEKGASYGRNLGAVLSDSESLVFSDDDVVASRDLLKLLEYLENSLCEGVQPLILRFQPKGVIDGTGDFVKRGQAGLYKPYIRDAGLKLDEKVGDLLVEELPSMRSAFMILNKDAFLSIDGFDISFRFDYEDVDLGWRMVAAGYTLLFIPTVRVLHKGGRTTAVPILDEEANRNSLVNFSAMQMKVQPIFSWPYILVRFLISLLRYELRPRGTEKNLATIARDSLMIGQLFMNRWKYVMAHRKILSEKFQFKGREKLDMMARGKRFIHYSST